METRTCRKCLVVKSLDADFSWRSAEHRSRLWICRPCKSKQNKQHRRKVRATRTGQPDPEIERQITEAMIRDRAMIAVEWLTMPRAKFQTGPHQTKGRLPVTDEDIDAVIQMKIQGLTQMEMRAVLKCGASRMAEIMEATGRPALMGSSDTPSCGPVIDDYDEQEQIILRLLAGERLPVICDEYADRYSRQQIIDTLDRHGLTVRDTVMLSENERQEYAKRVPATIAMWRRDDCRRRILLEQEGVSARRLMAPECRALLGAGG